MIYLLRHGLDDEARIGGYSDVSLTEEGIKELEKARKFINNLEFKKIISSDIKRCIDTTNIINKDIKKEVIYTDKLREQDKGEYTGVLKSSLPRDDYFLGKTCVYDTYPNGESLLDLYYRVDDLLLIMHKWDNDLLVTHRGVINMIYYLLNDKKPDMYKDSFNVSHASVHKLDLKNKKIERIY